LNDEEEPRFHPISALPAFAARVDDWLPGVLEMERLYGSAKPYVLKDDTIERTLRVYGEMKADLRLCEEQLRRWRSGALSVRERESVDHLSMQVARIRSAVLFVLGEAARLRTPPAV
jgi:hypothetical protein